MPTIAELKQLCRDKGIKGYSGMNKEALIKHCGYRSPIRSPSITNRTSKVPQISNKNKPTPKECEKWFQNKSVNPRNGYRVSKNGAIEKVLRENCKDKQNINPKRSSVPRAPSINTTTNRTSKVQISNKNKPTPKECDKWLQNKSVNPRNGRLVSKNGAIEKVLRGNCKEKQHIRVPPKPKRSIVPRAPPKPKISIIPRAPPKPMKPKMR